MSSVRLRSGRLFPVLALAGCAGAPTYLRAYGQVADREARLGWILLLIASAVVVTVSLLVLAAVFRRRSRQDGVVMREGGGIRWIVIGGVIVPTVILIGVLFVSTGTLVAVAPLPAQPAARIQVIGHRWWWEVRYAGARPSDIFTAANEIHVPVGQPVRLELATADVIHSFWIPQLAGKMDLIPGQHNVTWIEADTPGTYWGQCGEYCGLQHAHMGLSVVAEAPEQFERWLAEQRRPAATPSDGDAAAGLQVFTGSACVLCHAIRGTGAAGALGPDLTHLASRHTLAAGMLPNTQGTLAGWIANPQALKPGVVMPAVPLQPEQLRQLVAYLRELH